MGLAWAVGRSREVPGEEGISPEDVPRGAFREWGESPGRSLGGDGGVPGLRESVCSGLGVCVWRTAYLPAGSEQTCVAGAPG